MNNWQNFTKGFFKENPTFVLLLGMCPTLGVTTSAINGLGMGLATAFVLVLSNLAISLVANSIPDKIRIPGFIVIIAAFVTVVDMCMAAYLPSLARIIRIIHPVDRGKLYRVGTCRIIRLQEQGDSFHVGRFGYRLGLHDGSDLIGMHS